MNTKQCHDRSDVAENSILICFVWRKKKEKTKQTKSKKSGWYNRRRRRNKKHKIWRSKKIFSLWWLHILISFSVSLSSSTFFFFFFWLILRYQCHINGQIKFNLFSFKFTIHEENYWFSIQITPLIRGFSFIYRYFWSRRGLVGSVLAY